MSQSMNLDINSETSSKDNNGIHQEISERETSRPNCSVANSNTTKHTTSGTATSIHTTKYTEATATTTTDADTDSYATPTAFAAIAESYTEAGTKTWGMRLWKEEVN